MGITPGTNGHSGPYSVTATAIYFAYMYFLFFRNEQVGNGTLPISLATALAVVNAKRLKK